MPLTPGDLIRWQTPLYIVENGKEYAVKKWHYAVVLSTCLKPERYWTADVEVQLVGERATERISFSILAFFNKVTKIEKVIDKKWTAVVIPELVSED
jgi:hypothetical protein